MTPRFCVTLEGTVAQLSAELELERSRSASLHAEKAALRGHLAGIVSRLRPGQLPGSISPPRGALPPVAAADPVSAAAAALLAADESTGVPGQPLGEVGDGRLSLDAWGSTAAMRSASGSSVKGLDHQIQRQPSIAEASEGLSVPITPGRVSEPPVKGKGEEAPDQAAARGSDEREQHTFAPSCGSEDDAHVAKRGRADSAEDWTFASAMEQ